MKNKKAQIGETITWFAAFVIIFFLIMVFMFITIFLASKNPIKPEEISRITFEDNQQLLFSVLDYKTNYNNEVVSLKKLIAEYCINRDLELKNKITAIFQSELEDYYFKIEIVKEISEEKILSLTNYPDYAVEIRYSLSIINSNGAKINYGIEKI
jgi:hypothetical protein